jgi:hypothetical protein
MFANRKFSAAKSGKSRNRKRVFWTIFVISGLMLVYVWMKIDINDRLIEIRQLEEELNGYHREIEKLRADSLRLGNVGRIQKLAQERGLGVIPYEEVPNE